jgi:ankyrin repeat protein
MEMKRGGERWGLLLVMGFSEIGLPIMALLLLATILLAVWTTRSVRVSCFVSLCLVGFGVVADAGAVSWVVINRHLERQRCIETSPFYTSGLHNALEAGDVKRAREIVESGNVSWNENDCDGNTPLHIAAKRGDRPMMKMLLAHSTTDARDAMSAQDAEGRSPLHWAVLSGNIDLVKLLLDSGVRINDEDASSKTALAYAQRSRNEPMVKLLRERGGTSVDYERQIIMAAQDRNTARVEGLLSMGVKARRIPLLQIAAEQGDIAMAEMLLKKGEKVIVPRSLEKEANAHEVS